MSSIGDAIGAMTRAVLALSEARDAVRAVNDLEAPELEALARVRRRLENAGAQVELDRRMVEELVEARP